MKIDASQEILETTQTAQMKNWIDSYQYWIDSYRDREIGETTQRYMIRFKHESIHAHGESIQAKSETYLNRFIYDLSRFKPNWNTTEKMPKFHKGALTF